MSYLPPELWLIIDSFVNKLKFMENKRKLEKKLKFVETMFVPDNDTHYYLMIPIDNETFYYLFISSEWLTVNLIKKLYGFSLSYNLSNNWSHCMYSQTYFNNNLNHFENLTNINKILEYKKLLSKIKSEFQFKKMLNEYTKVQFKI